MMEQPDYFADFRDMALCLAALSVLFLALFLLTGVWVFQFNAIAGGVLGVLSAVMAVWESRRK